MMLATIGRKCAQNDPSVPELIPSLCFEYIVSTLINIGSNSYVDVNILL